MMSRKNKKSTASAKTTREPMLTCEEAADYCQVHVRSIWDWCADGSLKHIRLGEKSIRIRREDLDAFIEGKAVQA